MRRGNGFPGHLHFYFILLYFIYLFIYLFIYSFAVYLFIYLFSFAVLSGTFAFLL